MLLYLDDALIEQGREEANFFDFLSLMMLAYKEGKHVVIIAPKNVRTLLSDHRVNGETEQLLLHYSLHRKDALSYIPYFHVIVRMVPTAGLESSYSDVQLKVQMKAIHFAKFLDSANIQATILLGENGNDSEVYARFADYYRQQQNLTAFRLMYKRQSGGGDPTAEEYKAIYNTGAEFCLCILDSDRKVPERGFGETAKKVKRFHDAVPFLTANQKCDYHILEVLEVENILPHEFYANKYRDGNYYDSWQRLDQLHNVDSTARIFFDYKVGLKTFRDYEDAHTIDFWLPLVQQSGLRVKVMVEEEMYIFGYGKNILSQFLDYDAAQTFVDVNNTEFLKEIWSRLGRLIAAFILAPGPLRAI